MSLLEQIREEKGYEDLSEEELIKRFNECKEKHDEEVNKIVNGYDKLDMDKFVERIGGQKTISCMQKINEKADKLKSLYGNVSEIKSKTPSSNEEWKEEWKKGFMEGFEEAYKRLYDSK